VDSSTSSIMERTSTSRWANYVALAKVRLTTSVVISAGAGYLIGVDVIHWLSLMLLLVGGFFVVASSNAFNQVIERVQDAQMERTKDRPVAAGRMRPLEAMIFATLIGLAGLYLLYQINPMSAGFGALSLFIYTCIYTPLKARTPFAVFVGAIPGAIPFMLGWVAARNDFDIESGTLFALQFMWQFPHFWAIAWILFHDYAKVGYHLLPTAEPNRKTAVFIFVYTVWMMLISLAPATGFTGSLLLSGPAAVLVLLAGLWMLFKAYQLLMEVSVERARGLMLASVAYLPLVQIIYVLDRWIA